jgi:GT2 family glycosyltransferase
MSLSPLPSVSIVIPTWNGRFLLESMFPTLLGAANQYEASGGKFWEIIVIDDGGTDDTQNWIETVPEKRVKLITRRRNGGFSIACNSGFLACRYDVVVLLNNDVFVDTGFLAPLARHFQDPAVFAVTCKANARDQVTFCNGGKIGEFYLGFWKAFRNYDQSPGSVSPSHPLISFTACGGFCAFDRRKLLELGGFEPLMSPFYWEDVELSYRAWKRGWTILYEPGSVVYHNASTTINKTFRKIKIARIDTRNRFLFLWKNLHDPFMLLSHLGGALLLCLQAVLTLRLAFLLGLADALRTLPKILPKRWEERRKRRRKDQEILKMFVKFKKEADIVLK